MAVDLTNDINLVTTPSEVVNFDQNTPTTGGVVFTPDTPLTQDVLYVSSTNASTWIYDGETYVTYTATPTATTPFYIQDTTIDAGGNKTAPIQHNGYIKAYGFYGSGAGINFLNATYLAAGTVPTARLGSGTADSTTYLRGDGSWVSLSVSVPQANKIYVDSINGVDSTGRGRIDTPYLTPEYALSDITNNGTITATTTSASATLTSVSSTANIVIGQYITGAGIPYNTSVVSKTSNTITLSQNCTASATITATWWTIYELNLNGNFTATSNWFKQGFWIGNSTSVVYWGAFTLYNINSVQVIPYNNISNITYFGTTATSIFYANIVYSQDPSFILNINFNEVYSKTTDYLFQDGYMTATPNGTINIKGNKAVAYFGKVASLSRSFGNRNFNIVYSYGLLGGVDVYYGIGYNKWIGDVSTPLSVNAVNTIAGYASNFQYTGNVIGSVRFVGSGAKTILNANISGSTCYLQNCTFYGFCPGGTTLNGGVNFYGSFGSNAIYNASGYNKFFSYTDGYNLYITGGTADIQVECSLYYLSITAGKLIINAPMTTSIAAFSSGIEIINNSDFSHSGITIGGTFENKGRIINIASFIAIPTTAKLINRGVIKTSQVSTTIPLIQKDAGTLFLQHGSSLVVANSKPPIKCTANTSASKDIYMFNTTTNCDGSTYGLLFAFDGSSYAPNDLVGGVKYENTAYTF